MNDPQEKIAGILKNLPTKPGCYIYRNENGEVIYVGKAISLRHRVRSYFHPGPDQDYKTRQLVKKIADIEWIVVGSELEALILEMNLIKKHRPFFNIRLKDDKRYPYIKVNWADPFPKVQVTRQMVHDGSRYFGPYTSVWAVHQTLDVLRRIFQYLTCDRVITGKDTRACLYYDIKLCTAPCIGAINQEDYRQMIDDFCHFLEGKSSPILQRLTEEMNLAAEDLNFEKAATIRDQINSMQRVVEKQKVISDDNMDSDVIAMARDKGEACMQVFFIRGGKMIGRDYFILEGTEDEPDKEVLAEFLKQFYSESTSVPSQVLLPQEVEEAKIIQQWLKSKRGGPKVELKVPKRGKAEQLVEMAAENAIETLRSLKNQWETDTNRQTEALTELQNALLLAEPPNKIECYDISNTQGTSSVGSMVVFEQGIPKKSHYRRFNIKSVSGPNDFDSMQEVLTRRFKRWQASNEVSGPGSKPDPAFSILPDLLIVDGGKGQLSRAVEVLTEFDLLGKVPVMGLAKQEEELFVPGRERSVLLPRHSQGLYLVQRIRDEAHRFAITAHRNKRSKAGIASRLDSVKGIGPAKRKALLAKFGDIEGILNATIEELATVKGINAELANSIKMQLN
ncbi:MAG TPA: excinuclease ABC subunit UvrC [Bellilinea sp.]|nr:excinuclease ABC subunit UvrC [Bellilinea sp.]